MRRAEILALLRAHRDRARPVAFFHVLRQPALEADDQAFLLEHIEELGVSDLLRWRARCEKGFTGPVIRQLAILAIRDPAYFRHEVLDAPRLTFEDAEWVELADLLRGKVDDEIYRRIEARGARAPAAEAPPPAAAPAPAEESLSLADLLGDLGDEAPVGAPLTASAPPRLALSGGEDLSFFDGFEGLNGLEDGAAAAPSMLRELPPDDVDWSPSVTRFRPAFRAAVLERARSTPRGDERAVLLEWLGEQKVSKKQLVEIVADSIRSGAELTASVMNWLSRQFANRTAWDRGGTAVLVALIERRAFTEISDLMTFSLSEASKGDAGEAASGFLPAVQASFALALIRVTREALEAGRPDRAMAALSALACLDPPSRVSRSLHDLRRAKGAGEEVQSLIEVNERLVKHSDARDASLEGIVAAVHALADAFG